MQTTSKRARIAPKKADTAADAQRKEEAVVRAQAERFFYKEGMPSDWMDQMRKQTS